MLILIIILFSVAALLGVVLLSYVLADKNTPKGLAFIHGPVAAVGILTLLIYTILHSTKPWLSLILFIFAAFGGFMLIHRDITGKSLPKWMALSHGLTAVIAFVCLLVFAFF